MPERIPDEALAVRGGRNSPANILRDTGIHPSGVTGISIECNSSVSVDELAENIPHNQIGVTTVEAIRAAGGDVVRTSGRSPHHATMIGLSPEKASRLFTPTRANPTKGS